MIIRYHLRTGDVIEHSNNGGSLQELTDFHSKVFEGDDGARLTLDTSSGAHIIRVGAIDWVEILTEGGG